MRQNPPEVGRITVPRTARYWSIGPVDTAAKGTLYALHGYGQLAEYFIRKFQPMADAGWRVVAPEGGHRFYLKGTDGRVGASWMTKEDRLSDIQDYITFLDRLRGAIDHEEGTPEVLLGFSQGVATALRWMALGTRGAGSWQGAIAHSGVIPPDLPGRGSALASAPDLHLIAGKADPYITDVERGFRSSEELWREGGGQIDRVHRHMFDGGHSVDATTVLKAIGHMIGAWDSPNFET